MGILRSELTTPELLGRLRHLYMAIGSVLIGVGLTMPDWIPVIFSETFTQMLFIAIGAVIDVVQVIRSINAPEKKIFAGRNMMGISPELAGTLRQLLTMLGTLLVIFKIPVPEWMINLVSEQGVNLIIDAIGAVMTYISFILSKNAKEKQIGEREFAEARRIQV